MELDLPSDDHSTLLDDEDLDGIAIPGITTRNQLNEHEQKNIEDANQWLLGKKLKPEQILRETFIKKMHQRMLGKVWKWAGKFRIKKTNIGIKPEAIQIQLRQLLDDTKHWIENETFSPEEIAIRFKHRLVSIHGFANGNGRHSRLMADIIMEKIYGQHKFTWGSKNLISKGAARETYINALHAADKGNYKPLIKFAHS